jgi:hypothetical protein
MSHLTKGRDFEEESQLGDDVILNVAVQRPIICLTICGVQSESLRRRLIFHQSVPYGRDNAIGISRKFLTDALLTGRTIFMRMNFLGIEPVMGSDITIDY